jgi:hypothetical protein
MKRARGMIVAIDFAAYLGLRVAIVHGRVTGVGTTATQARLAAKQQLAKEEPILVFVTKDRLRMDV